MAKHQSLIKLFIVLFVSTAFIFSSSHFGAKAFENMANADGTFPEGTAVGSIDVSGKSENEAIALLDEKYVEWLANTKIELQYSEKIVPFDLNFFHFDATQTVYSIVDGQRNSASINIELLQVEEQIKNHFPQLDTSVLELTKLTTDLTNTASKFEQGSFTLNLNKDYFIGNAKDEVISTAVVPLTTIPTDLESVLAANPAIKIAEGATFTLIELVKLHKLENSSSLNVIASGIYQAILPTNFEITERNISNALPNYTGLGFEARVNVVKGADLIFTNPNQTPYTLELKVENNQLFVALKGQDFLYDYKISKKDEQQLKPKTIVQYSPFVLPGQTKVETVGADGKIVKIYRDIYEGSELIKSEFISEDYYPPVYRIEIQGLAGTQQSTTTQSTTTNETNPNGSQTTTSSDSTEVDSDDNLWGKPNEQPK